MTRGYLFPNHSGMVLFEAGGAVTLLSTFSGWTSTVTGTLADDVGELLKTGTAGERLLALAEVHPVAETILRWAEDPGLELTLPNVLKLDGFGTLFLELVGQCNEKCAHCYAGSSPAITDALPRDICESIVDDAAALGFSRIQFTGGDPLLCTFLPELVERAAERGIPMRERSTPTASP